MTTCPRFFFSIAGHLWQFQSLRTHSSAAGSLKHRRMLLNSQEIVLFSEEVFVYLCNVPVDALWVVVVVLELSVSCSWLNVCSYNLLRMLLCVWLQIWTEQTDVHVGLSVWGHYIQSIFNYLTRVIFVCWPIHRRAHRIPCNSGASPSLEHCNANCLLSQSFINRTYMCKPELFGKTMLSIISAYISSKATRTVYIQAHNF